MNLNKIYIQLIILVLFCYKNLYSKQLNNTPAKFNGISVSANYSSLTEYFLVPAVDFNFNRHSFYFGPKIILSQKENDNSRLGVMLGYKIYPNFRTERFSFYFHYTNHFRRDLDDNTVCTNNICIQSRANIYWENVVGYGFNLSISKGVYFFNDFGIGIANEWNTFENSETISNTSINLLIKAGIGYYFDRTFSKSLESTRSN